MAYDVPVLDVSKPTTVSLASDQFYFAADDGSGNAVLNTTQGKACIGVLQNDPIAGQVATVRVYGISKVVAGAALAPGVLVESDALGRAIALVDASSNTTTGASTGGFCMGMTLDSSAAAGDLVTVLINHTGAVAGTPA
jgi:hypothetical protein